MCADWNCSLHFAPLAGSGAHVLVGWWAHLHHICLQPELAVLYTSHKQISVRLHGRSTRIDFHQPLNIRLCSGPESPPPLASSVRNQVQMLLGGRPLAPRWKAGDYGTIKVNTNSTNALFCARVRTAHVQMTAHRREERRTSNTRTTHMHLFSFLSRMSPLWKCLWGVLVLRRLSRRCFLTRRQVFPLRWSRSVEAFSEEWVSPCAPTQL